MANDKINRIVLLILSKTTVVEMFEGSFDAFVVLNLEKSEDPKLFENVKIIYADLLC